MRIIEILSNSAILLGLKDEHILLENATAQEEQETTEQELLKNEKIKSLFNLIKYSLQELCTNYIPVVSKTSVNSTEKTIKVGELENFIKVQNITKNGNKVKYKVVNRVIQLEETGEYEIEYLTYPTITSIFEDVDFLSKFSNDVIACSVCAYFSLANGMFDEFKDFHEMYVEKAENIKELKCFNLPKRRWE